MPHWMEKGETEILTSNDCQDYPFMAFKYFWQEESHPGLHLCIRELQIGWTASDPEALKKYK